MDSHQLNFLRSLHCAQVCEQYGVVEADYLGLLFVDERKRSAAHICPCALCGRRLDLPAASSNSCTSQAAGSRCPTPVHLLPDSGARCWLNLRNPIGRQALELLGRPALLAGAPFRVHLRIKYWVAAPRFQQASTRALAFACARGDWLSGAFLLRHRDLHLSVAAAAAAHKRTLRPERLARLVALFVQADRGDLPTTSSTSTAAAVAAELFAPYLAAVGVHIDDVHAVSCPSQRPPERPSSLLCTRLSPRTSFSVFEPSGSPEPPPLSPNEFPYQCEVFQSVGGELSLEREPSSAPSSPVHEQQQNQSQNAPGSSSQSLSVSQSLSQSQSAARTQERAARLSVHQPLDAARIVRDAVREYEALRGTSAESARYQCIGELYQLLPELGANYFWVEDRLREPRLVCVCRDSVRLLSASSGPAAGAAGGGELQVRETLHFSLVTKASVSARVVYITVHSSRDLRQSNAHGFRCRSRREADALYRCALLFSSLLLYSFLFSPLLSTCAVRSHSHFRFTSQSSLLSPRSITEVK